MEKKVPEWKRKATRNKNPLMSPGTHKHGQKSEARVCEGMGARQTIASGAIPGMKSDGVLEGFRIECKATIHHSMTLQYDWLLKIRREALETNRCPVLTISFVDVQGDALQGGDWAVIPQHMFNDFAEWMEKNGS